MAMSFVGSSETAVVLGNPSHLDFNSRGNNFTLMGWVKVTPGNTGTIIAKRDFFGGQYHFAVETGGYLGCYMGNNQSVGATEIDDGEWHHLAAANYLSASTYYFDIYVNGVKDESTALSGVQDGFGDDVVIGAYRTTVGVEGYSWVLTGDLADVRAYNRALLVDEIATIYTCRGNDNIVYGLAGRWPLNEKPPGTAA